MLTYNDNHKIEFQILRIKKKKNKIVNKERIRQI